MVILLFFKNWVVLSIFLGILEKLLFLYDFYEGILRIKCLCLALTSN